MEGWEILLLLLIVYLASCFFIGHFAQKTGRSFTAWLLLALIFSPVMIGIVLLIAHAIFGETQKYR